MKLGVRGKLFFVSLLLIGAAGLVSAIYLEQRLRTWMVERIEADMHHHALAGRALIAAAGVSPASSVDPLADELGDAVGVRITVLAHDGRVLGDSELAGQALGEVENHGGRPEVVQALTGGRGISRRFSTTLSTEMLYVAVPYGVAPGVGVVRAATPLSEVELVVARLRWLVLFAAAVGVVLAVLMSALASHFAAGSIRALLGTTLARAQKEHASLLVTAEGEVSGSGSFNLLSEKLERTVQDLADSRGRVDRVLSSLSEGVVALDDSGRITLMNPAAERLLALDPSLIGTAWAEAAGVPELVNLDREEDETGEIEFSGPGGRTLVAETTPLKSDGGTVIVFRDETQMRRLESVRRDFVANISHELRTPVSVIFASAENLIDGALEDEDVAVRFVDAIHRNALRLSRIISELLDLARIEAGQTKMRVRSRELVPIVTRAVDDVIRSAQGKEMTIEIHVPPGLHAQLDDGALEHVLINLLDNAVKYGPTGATIDVRATVVGDRVRLEVADDGPGVEPAHRSRIFERFYRADAARSADRGTGLGLAIVRHLVQQMGGEVGVDPNEPKGSVFWLELPRGEVGQAAA